MEGGTKFKQTTDQRLYAHWRGKESIVTFDSNGGKTSKDSKSVYYGNTYGSLPKTTRTGYNFEGWYTSPGATKEITENDNV